MSKPKKRTSKSKGVPKKNSKIQNDKDQKIKKINRKKGIAGFIVLFLIVYLIPSIANFIITEIKTMVVSIIDGMY